MAIKSEDKAIAQEILCDANDEMAALVHKKYKLPHYRKNLVESDGKRLVECKKDCKWAGGIFLWSKEDITCSVTDTTPQLNY